MSVTLHTTLGDIKLELFCERCPRTCENFLALCGTDKYNNCVFHRVVKGFIVQTGDPTNTGKGGQSIWNEPFADEIHEDLSFDARGVLAMASNGPNTNKSQFFITCAKHTSIDGKYTIFGKMIDGFDTLEELENLKVNASYRPVVEQRIKSITIHANPIADVSAAN
ncbi:Peptidyl-prolyl cis-trans isomerase [Aphelenchoides besseyi]|nr:Peptidyl-prolyl cis-trans isomerase [Aphelenchoides besseyi]KAI6210111.1 Peptidyl-prolyl cis-trans isomerase [Aphelenchoides besseyi]